MMENKLYLNNDIESKIKKYESSTEFLKDQNKIIQNSNLIEFISNLNKFKFDSCFDCKGAKLFLKTKGLALKEISIDDYLIEEKEEIKDKKSEKKRHKSVSSKAMDTEASSQIRNGFALYKKKIKSMKHLNLFYNYGTTLQPQVIKKKKSKKKHYKSGKKHNNISNIIMEEFNLDKRKKKKFCSRIEKNMFNDQYLKRIKPIPEKSVKSDLGSNKVNTFNANNNFEFAFVKSDDSKTNSTLLDIVSEI